VEQQLDPPAFRARTAWRARPSTYAVRKVSRQWATPSPASYRCNLATTCPSVHGSRVVGGNLAVVPSVERRLLRGVHRPLRRLMYWAFIDIDPNGFIVDFPYDISLEARRASPQPMTEEFAPNRCRNSSHHPSGESGGPVVEGYTLVPLLPSGVIIARAVVRSFRFAPISSHEMVEELSSLEAAERLQASERGEHEPNNSQGLAAFRQRTRGWTREGVVLGDITYDLPRAW
jgi:hypothetical protein